MFTVARQIAFRNRIPPFAALNFAKEPGLPQRRSDEALRELRQGEEEDLNIVTFGGRENDYLNYIN